MKVRAWCFFQLSFITCLTTLGVSFLFDILLGDRVSIRSKKSQIEANITFIGQCEEVCRLALKRRYRLIPHIYTLFYLAHTRGTPVASPPFFAGWYNYCWHGLKSNSIPCILIIEVSCVSRSYRFTASYSWEFLSDGTTANSCKVLIYSLKPHFRLILMIYADC